MRGGARLPSGRAPVEEHREGRRGRQEPEEVRSLHAAAGQRLEERVGGAPLILPSSFAAAGMSWQRAFGPGLGWEVGEAGSESEPAEERVVRRLARARVAGRNRHGVGQSISVLESVGLPSSSSSLPSLIYWWRSCTFTRPYG